MVFESRIAELLRNQASRFLRGFSAEQLQLGLLNGRLGLTGLTLNPEPLDTLLLESEVPLVLKAGTVANVSAQLSLLQGELELNIDGLALDFGVACRWLTETEISGHRANEIQRLEFVHTRSQSQRRNVEREMFRQVFSDYLSRLKLTIRNVHLRIEVEGELDCCGRISQGADAVFGMVLNSCEVTPIKKSAAASPTGDADAAAGDASRELLLAERADIKGLSLYHEGPETAKVHVSWDLYSSTRSQELGAFEVLKQETFLQAMRESRRRHAAAAASEQLMPPTSFSVRVDLRSQPACDGFHLDSCMTMEVAVKLEAPSLLNFTACTVEHIHWLVRRALDFQLWQFLHAVGEQPQGAKAQWSVLRDFVGLKRRIHSSTYSLKESVQMRIHCKEYVRLHKRKFNGPTSDVVWRKSMPTLTDEETKKLDLIELTYPADKIVNFRLMAHSELKTEVIINSSLTADDVAAQSYQQGVAGSNPYRRVARELTPLEQLHLHGQHGYGVNIYRGLPPPPSSLKIRIDVNAPQGMLWVCSLPGTQPEDRAEDNWVFALDCMAQAAKLSLVDSTVDASVFATLEVPAAANGKRPLALLLARSPKVFTSGSPGRVKQRGAFDADKGGNGAEEWYSILEFHGTVYCCSQLKTLLTASACSPWDIIGHLSCGEVSDGNVTGPAEVATPLRNRHGAKSEKGARLRLQVPLVLADRRRGPFRSVFNRGQNAGPEHSALAWFARQISSTYTIAVFRLHVRLPPLEIMGSEGSDVVQLPRFDGACHLEQGGLVDGFVVGLHHLRHFVGSLATGAGASVAERNGNSSRAATAPLSLAPLQNCAPLDSVAASLMAALAVVLAGRSQPPARNGASAALALAKEYGLAGLFSDAQDESPVGPSLVSLLLVVLAVMNGRRILWDACDSRPGSRSAQAPEVVERTSAAMGDIYNLFGEMLSIVFAMGLPMHPRCMPLAAWSGALELLQRAVPHAQSCGLWPSRGLVVWAARGAFANLPTRQDEVVRWLARQGARIDEVDKAGRSLLDWACWAGSEDLVGTSLRAGLMTPSTWRVGKLAGDSLAPPSLPSPLALAITSRSRSVVSLLIRAASDPHSSPKANSCSPLLLAVRNCEYELASLILRDAPFVAVDSALSAPLQQHREAPEGTLPSVSTRATVAVIESLGRFSSILSRRSAGEDPGSSSLLPGGGSRQHSPGPHLDEGLFSTSQMPFNDVIHPLLVRLPPPLHQASSSRPQCTPHSWLQKNIDPWQPAQLFISSCLGCGRLTPDPMIVSRALPALPADARKLAQQLLPCVVSEVPTSDMPPATLLTTAPGSAGKPGFRGSDVTRTYSAKSKLDPYTLHVSPTIPTIWLTVSSRVKGQAASPISLDTLCVDGSHLAWNPQDMSEAAALPLRSVQSVRRFEVSGGEAQHVVELSVAPDASSDVSGDGRGSTVNVIFKSCDTADQFAEALRIRWQSAESGDHSDPQVIKSHGGPWEAATLSATIRSREQPVTEEPGARPGPGGLRPTSKTPQPGLLAVRVVVAGTPNVGKSKVASCLCSQLGDKSCTDTNSTSPAWLSVVNGSWPSTSDKPRAEVHVWDTQAAPLPGLWNRMIDEDAVPLLLVVVTDSGLTGISTPADFLLTEFVSRATRPAAPRSVLVVENAASLGSRSPGSSVTPPQQTMTRRVRCDLRASEGRQELQAAFNDALEWVVGAMEAGARTRRASTLLPAGKQGDWCSNIAVCPSLPPLNLALDPAGDETLAARLRGDTMLLDPSVLTWTWAAVCSAQACLAESSRTGSCGGALVSWDKLSRVLATAAIAAGATDGLTAAPALLRALADLGLLCPVPVLPRSTATSLGCLDCGYVLVPDFARRIRLAAGNSARLSGSGSSETNGEPGGSARKRLENLEGSAAPVPLSARLLWDAMDSRPPSLRTTLRDFLARGALGVNATSNASMCMQIHRFVLLQSGPDGAPGPAAADDLAPGFLLIFDLVPAGEVDGRLDLNDCQQQQVPAKPAEPQAAAGNSMPNPAAEDEMVPPALRHFTTIIIGTSCSCSTPYWDVFCNGPHAQWALRALLGSGASGPSFAAFQRSEASSEPVSCRSGGSASSTATATWPMPRPACTISTTSSSAIDASERPTGIEFLGLSWLFNGPKAAAARLALLPSVPREANSSLALCCAALCGRRGPEMTMGLMGLEESGLVEGLSSCADFEVSLLSRSWRAAPRCLDEALASGAEAWALCALVLARVAHDSAADVAGSYGRALPLLHASKEAVTLVPEGPQPLVMGVASSPKSESLGSIRACAGVQAWLRLCKPAALWSAAGGSRGFIDGSGTMQSKEGTGASVGVQVVDALQAALAVQFTEQMVREVWEALAELDAAHTLMRRAGGTWTRLSCELAGFVL